MSILLVEIVPQGMIFGADRNITWQMERSDREHTVIEYHGHTQRPKVLRWPDRRALIGYVGEGQIGRIATDEWVHDFIGRHFAFRNLESLAEALRSEVETQRRLDEGNAPASPLIFYLAGFEVMEGMPTPFVWVVRNAHGPDGISDFRKEFVKSEAFWRAFNTTPRAHIRSHLAEMASQFNPFWFHQGFDLQMFNTIEAFLKTAFRVLCETHPDHSTPSSLVEWESQVRMSILTYGAYFQAYRGPSEQFVGGGVDVVSIPWPEIR
jgi:hypothetical protein